MRRRTANDRTPDPASPRATRPGSGLDGVPAEPAPPALVEAVQATVVHELRAQGFTGELPHLRRLGPDRVDLLSIHLSGEGVHIVAGTQRPGAHPHPDGTRAPAQMPVQGDPEHTPHRLSLLVDGRAPAERPQAGVRPPKEDLNARRRWQAFWPDDGALGRRPDEALGFRHPSVVASQAWTVIQEQVMPFWESGA